jgi:hypothetical protein
MRFWQLPAVSGEDDGRGYALIEVEAAADFVVEKTNPFAEVDQLPGLGGFRHTGIGGAMGFWELPAVSGEDDGRCYALIEIEPAADFVV